MPKEAKHTPAKVRETVELEDLESYTCPSCGAKGEKPKWLVAQFLHVRLTGQIDGKAVINRAKSGRALEVVICPDCGGVFYGPLAFGRKSDEGARKDMAGEGEKV